MTASEVQAIIAEADLNGDGKLDYSEFCLLLSNTSNDCIQANYQKSLRQLHEHRYSQSDATRTRLDRHDKHGEDEPSWSSTAPANGNTQSGVHASSNSGGESNLEAFLTPLSKKEEPNLPASTSSVQDVRKAETQPSKLPLATEAKKDRELRDKSTKLPPLRKVSLPSLQPHPLDGIEDTDSTTGKPSYNDGEKDEVSRQTDHLQEEELPHCDGTTMEQPDGGVGMPSDTAGISRDDNAGQDEAGQALPSSPNVGKGEEGQVPPSSVGEREEEEQWQPLNDGKGKEGEAPPSNGGGLETPVSDDGKGKDLPPNSGREEEQLTPPTGGSSLTEDAERCQAEGDRGADKALDEGRRGEAMPDRKASASNPVHEEAAPSSVVAPPPRKPDNVEVAKYTIPMHGA